MKKLLLFSLLLITSLFADAQKTPPVNLFLHGQTSFMPYGIFKKYTGAGFGAGMQGVLNSKNKLKPQLDVTANLFAVNKILFVFANGETTGPAQSVVTVFGGFIYGMDGKFELALSAGPAFDEDGTDFGIKPYAAYYLGKRKIIKAQTSLTHLFSPNKYSKKNAGIISAGLAIKLF